MNKLLKYGLVLGGGGAKGGYQIGVWKALKELEVPIIAVTGTSVGALNGALIVQDDFQFACNLWTSISIKAVINMNKELASKDHKQNSTAEIMKLITSSINSGGLDVAPLRILINEAVNERKIRESEIKFGFVTFSLTDLKPVYIFKEDVPDGKMADYLLASASFPAFKPQEIGDKKYIDGGVSDNIPISMMIAKDIHNIIAVDVSGIGVVKKIKSKKMNIINIKNSEDLGGTLDFSGVRSLHNIEVGYYDAMKAFGIYKGKRYYIANEKSSITLTKDHIESIYSFLEIENNNKLISSDKLISHSLLKTLKKYSIGKLTESNAIMAMAEITAEQIGILRLKAYDLEELIEKIYEQYNEIIINTDFKDYMKTLKDKLTKINKLNFDKELRAIIIDSKFLIFYDEAVSLSDDLAKTFKRFIALVFPKTFIANIFISLIKANKGI